MPRKKVTIVGGGMTGGAMAQRLIERNIGDVILQDDPQFAGTMHLGKALDESEARPRRDPGGSRQRRLGRDGGLGRRNRHGRGAAQAGHDARGTAERQRRHREGEGRRAAKASPNAVVIIFANPMDAMCQVAMKASGFPRERVVGQGGALDSARYRYFVAADGVSVRDVHGYVIGGHTDTTMVPVVSQTRVGGVPLTYCCRRPRWKSWSPTLCAAAPRSASCTRRSRYFAPSSATITMTESILMDQRRLIPCSVYKGEYGIRDVFSGTVCQLGEGGIQRTRASPHRRRAFAGGGSGRSDEGPAQAAELDAASPARLEGRRGNAQKCRSASGRSRTSNCRRHWTASSWASWFPPSRLPTGSSAEPDADHDHGRLRVSGAPHWNPAGDDNWQFQKERFFSRLMHESDRGPNVPWPYLLEESREHLRLGVRDPAAARRRAAQPAAHGSLLGSGAAPAGRRARRSLAAVHTVPVPSSGTHHRSHRL